MKAVASRSPYEGKDPSDWPKITKRLVEAFPLKSRDIVEVVHKSWTDIYATKIGSAGLRLGIDVFLPAQATGVLLERLVVGTLARTSDNWAGGVSKVDKDVIYKPNGAYSFEIKTSSSKAGLFGNRSTGQESERRTKVRTGYYLVVNYKLPSPADLTHLIRLIRFGWIDDADWTGQAQPTGQQASVSREVLQGELLTLYAP